MLPGSGAPFPLILLALKSNFFCLVLVRIFGNKNPELFYHDREENGSLLEGLDEPKRDEAHDLHHREHVNPPDLDLKQEDKHHGE